MLYVRSRRHAVGRHAALTRQRAKFIPSGMMTFGTEACAPERAGCLPPSAVALQPAVGWAPE